MLAAAAEQIETVGAQGLSLRGVAAQAGLSRQAPYNHFANKEALLAELAGQGFARLRADICAVAGYPDGVQALERAGAAYIDFAQASPAMFHLMFSRELVDLSQFPDIAAVADSAFQSLVDIIATFAPSSSVDDLALAAWCLVHGYATLCIELGLEAKVESARRASLFAQLIKANVDGR